MQCSDEAKSADRGTTSYSTAIQRAYVTRSRFALARPTSVVLLGHGNSCIFRGGVVAYEIDNTIRILDVQNAIETEDVVDVRAFMIEEASHWPRYATALQELLASTFTIYVKDFRSGILTSKVYNGMNQHVFMVNTREEVSLESRLRKVRTYTMYQNEMETNGRYMFFVSFSRANDFEFPYWVVDCYDLEDTERVMPSFFLKEIWSSDPGNDTAFEIYDDWFYILCNKHEVMPDDEGDSKSYYYCYRFPVDDFHPVPPWKLGDFSAWSPHSPLPARLEIVRIKRQRPWISVEDRRYARPPWHKLQLLQDERTGNLLIVEGLQDSQSGTAQPQARYSFQPLVFPDLTGYTVTSSTTQIGNIIQTLDVEDLPQVDPAVYCPGFISNKVGIRGYRPSSSASWDLSIHPGSSKGSRNRNQFCLSVGFRGYLSPIDSATGLVGSSSSQDGKLSLVDCDGDPLMLRGVHQFPPDNVPESLTELLCASSMNEAFCGATTNDEPAILCVTGSLSRDSGGRQRILFIYFDPWINFPGLQRLKLPPQCDPMSYEYYEERLGRSQLVSYTKLWRQNEEKRSRKQDKRKDTMALENSKRRRILRFVLRKRTPKYRSRLLKRV